MLELFMAPTKRNVKHSNSTCHPFGSEEVQFVCEKLIEQRNYLNRDMLRVQCSTPLKSGCDVQREIAPRNLRMCSDKLLRAEIGAKAILAKTCQ
jgi:hypothetical protein